MKPTAILVATLILLLIPLTGPAADFSALRKWIGPRDAILVADPQGKILFSKNADQEMIPASTLKIFTALTALHYLKPGYRFPTNFYGNSKGDLIIKGFGDPLLISEVMPGICMRLAGKVETVRDIVLDDTFFDPIRIPGVSPTFQPYDSPVGALCANFNSVFFKRAGGKFVSAEPQTPLLPFVMDRVRASGFKQERIILTGKNRENVRYVGHLFRHFLKQAGIRCTGTIRLGKSGDPSQKVLLRWESPFSLETVLKRLLKYSNNFIANQLFITAGTIACGTPGTLEKGIKAARSYGRNLLGMNMTIQEGSGISRKNRISAKGLFQVLKTFRSLKDLLKKKGRQYYKTGHLSGIRARVGYIENRKKEFFAFVVLVNTPGKTAAPIIKELLRQIR